MIRTKQAQVIDARTNKSEIVYFHLMDEVRREQSQTVSFYIATSYHDGTEFKQFGDISIAIFTKATFLKLYGELTTLDFEMQKDELMIAQIDYINKYIPTGEENNPFTKYWNLTSEDLEIVK